MANIFTIMDEMDERGYGQRGGYGMRDDMDHMLEKAFKDGCEHGYKKAMREADNFDERRGRTSYREGFEEKIEMLKKKYK